MFKFVDIADGISRIKQLKPRRFNFKTEPGETVDGFNSYIISDAVSKENFKVALSGTGSDELFLGYPFYAFAKRFEESKWIQSFPPIINF